MNHNPEMTARLEQENARLAHEVSALGDQLAAAKTQLVDLAKRHRAELAEQDERHKAELVELTERFEEKTGEMKQRIAWFERQLFGRKSEKRLEYDFIEGGNLFVAAGMEEPAAETPQEMPAPREKPTPEQKSPRKRRNKQRGSAVNDIGLRFDPSVPVKTVYVDPPALEGDKLVGEREVCKLAREPSRCHVLRYVYRTVKREDGRIETPPAVPAVLPGRSADVSFLSGMLVDKFCYHLPLYRQHQMLEREGIRLSRRTLTDWTRCSAELLEPIWEAQRLSALDSRVLAMDETTIRVGPDGKGSMNRAQLWPIYGDRDELVFHYAPSRAHGHAETFLEGFEGVLLSDGYAAYEAWLRAHPGAVLAQCWAHARRKFEDIKALEPDLSGQALELIGELYREEKAIRKLGLEGSDKRDWRQEHSAPVVARFRAWVEAHLANPALRPKSRFAKALTYASRRWTGLEAYLDDPGLAIDTNHLERGNRPVKIGQKNWLFCWTEVGAWHSAIVYSLLATCILHDVNPTVWLIDVLQRIDSHPQSRVGQLTPRLWKQNFGAEPLLSDTSRATLEPPVSPKMAA